MVKKPSASAGDVREKGLIFGSRRSPGFKIQNMDNGYESVVFKILVNRKKRTVVPETQVINKVKPYNCPRSLCGEFPGNGALWVHLLELRRQINRHNVNQNPR